MEFTFTIQEEAGWESWGEEESSMQASGADADRSVIEDIIADLKNDNENLLLAAASASRPTDDVMLVSPSTLQYSVKYKVNLKGEAVNFEMRFSSFSSFYWNQIE